VKPLTILVMLTICSGCWGDLKRSDNQAKETGNQAVNAASESSAGVTVSVARGAKVGPINVGSDAIRRNYRATVETTWADSYRATLTSISPWFPLILAIGLLALLFAVKRIKDSSALLSRGASELDKFAANCVKYATAQTPEWKMASDFQKEVEKFKATVQR